MKKPNKTKFSRSRLGRPQSLVLLIFVVGFVGFGVYKLASSSAATSTVTSTTFSGVDNAKMNNPNVRIVPDSVSYVGTTVNVVQLRPTYKALLSPNRGGGVSVWLRTCYYVRALNSPVNMSISSDYAQATFDVPTDFYYSKYCVNDQATGTTRPNFSVRNNSGGLLNVYQAIYEFNELPPQ